MLFLAVWQALVRRDCVVCLKAVLDSKVLSMQVRCSLIDALTKLIGEFRADSRDGSSRIPGVAFDWQPLWAETMAIARRENGRHEASSTDRVLADYLGKLAKLLHPLCGTK